MGIGLGLGMRTPAAALWTPLRSSVVRDWYDPTRVTLVGGNVATWTDQGLGAKNLSQAIAAQRPPHVSAGGVFGTLPHLSFVAANDHELGASSTADWKFIHDGTGMFVAMRFRPTAAAFAVLASTLGLSSSSVGMSLVWDPTSSGFCQLLVSNGSGGGYEANIQTLNGSAPINAAHTVIAWFSGASVGIEVDGATPVTGAFSGSPSSGNPDYPLTIGARPGSSANSLTGEIADVVIGTGAPDAELRTRLRQFLGRTA